MYMVHERGENNYSLCLLRSPLQDKHLVAAWLSQFMTARNGQTAWLAELSFLSLSLFPPPAPLWLTYVV